MAAFYTWLGHLFYWCGGALNCDRFHCSRFDTLFLRLHLRSEVEKIIYRMTEILFAPQIAFRRLDRCMPEQKLNLLDSVASTDQNWLWAVPRCASARPAP